LKLRSLPFKRFFLQERQQPLQILVQNDSASGAQTELKALGKQFWQGIPLKELPLSSSGN
jgi:hypothetical protein